jgi:hypothetical protein
MMPFARMPGPSSHIPPSKATKPLQDIYALLSCWNATIGPYKTSRPAVLCSHEDRFLLLANAPLAPAAKGPGSVPDDGSVAVANSDRPIDDSGEGVAP